MKKKTGRLSIFPALFVLVVACVTINIYFPAAAVEKAADAIVEETWGDEGVKPKTTGVEKEGFFDRGIRYATSTIGVREAHAQEADINVTTPAIRALKASIGERSDAIKPHMDQGHVGIGNDGLLVIRSSEGMSLKDKAALKRLIKAENRDRETLYREIANANKFEADRVADIRGIFAKSWIKNARRGWWVQGDNGQWSQK